ncbi:hypothetical protein PM10SUCC1_33050 [Propionigenium maris DSM 9537]|uniref:Uncharacterized protein n=1 Tax=Propionigenium maris DSM 9537 TaxID=1123000 RepID=A0A9W6GPQ6_9FUSO|nr:DUF960 family protein [Propionigenium maris]GLI57791.1 hypothetical protein PM10SUCC1_33050 [Propionigenium maris DSM 9537]
MEKFYITKGVYETLDMRIITYIQTLIKSMDIEVDYLQVFSISGNVLIHTQEVPEYIKEYTLSKEYRDEKLFSIKTEEENSNYWTLMLAHEY